MQDSEFAEKILRAKCLTSIGDLSISEARIDLTKNGTGEVVQVPMATSNTDSGFLDLTSYDTAAFNVSFLFADSFCCCRKLRHRDDATAKVRRILNEVRLAESIIVPLMIHNTQHE
jgi:hypothetical protein